MNRAGSTPGGIKPYTHDLNRAGSTPGGIKPYTHYCLIRQDLPRGVLAAQLIHAAGESAPGGLPSGTIAVALAARDEAHLLALELQLRQSGISHRAIREPDTPWNGALMAIGIVPIADRARVREVTGGLRLLR